MKRGNEPSWTNSTQSLGHTINDSNSETDRRSHMADGNGPRLSVVELESDMISISKDNTSSTERNADITITYGEADRKEDFDSVYGSKTVEPEERQLFEHRYDILEELGKGRYGIVRKVVDKSVGINLAAKFVRAIKAKDRQQVLEEINIMNILKHPKLLTLVAAYESPKEMIMVTEYISGGELFERVVADDFTLTERDSILFVQQICEGVEYMHNKKVVHMDLKPENIMCQTRTSHRIKLIDFGLAQTLKPNTPVRVLFGTPEFISPEIIGFEPIGTESDMWSIGVICYVLLTGLSPFMGDNDAETFANITRADYDFDDTAFDTISQEAMNFISGLLIKRKELRMSATDCLKHSWLTQCAEHMSRIALSTDKLKKFIVRRKWQKTGNAIRALGRMASLSANSRKNTLSKYLPSSDTIYKESVPSEIKTIHSLSESSSEVISEPFNKNITDDVFELREHAVLDTDQVSLATTINHSLSAANHFKPENLLHSIEDEEEFSVHDLKPANDLNFEVCNNVNSMKRTQMADEPNMELLTDIETSLSDLSDKNTNIATVDNHEDKSIACENISQRVVKVASSYGQHKPSFDHSTNMPFISSNTSTDNQVVLEENKKNSTDLIFDLKENPTNIDEKGLPSRPRFIPIHGCDTHQDEGEEEKEGDEEEEEGRDLTFKTIPNHRIVHTGSVSRTAKMFEQQVSSPNRQPRSPTSRTTLPTANARPQNERIRKAFAFWNK